MDGTCGCSTPSPDNLPFSVQGSCRPWGSSCCLLLVPPLPSTAEFRLDSLPSTSCVATVHFLPRGPRESKRGQELKPTSVNLDQLGHTLSICTWSVAFFLKELEVPHGLGSDSPWRNILTSACRMCPPKSFVAGMLHSE